MLAIAIDWVLESKLAENEVNDGLLVIAKEDKEKVTGLYTVPFNDVKAGKLILVRPLFAIEIALTVAKDPNAMLVKVELFSTIKFPFRVLKAGKLILVSPLLVIDKSYNDVSELAEREFKLGLFVMDN